MQKPIYYKNNNDVLLEYVSLNEISMFNNFIVDYLNFFQYILPVTGMLGIKCLMLFNTNTILIISIIFLIILLIFSSNSVIYLIFKIYLSIKKINTLLDEIAYAWVKQCLIRFRNVRHNYVNKSVQRRMYSTSSGNTSDTSSKNIKFYAKEYGLPKQTVLTEPLVKSIIIQFWKEVFEKINTKNPNSHLLLLIKLHFEGNKYRTMLNLKHVNLDDRQKFIDDAHEKIDSFADQYFVDQLLAVSFTYAIRPGKALFYDNRQHEPQESGHRFNNTVLPISMNPEDYGRIMRKDDTDIFIKYDVEYKQGKHYTIETNTFTGVNTVTGPGDIYFEDSKVSDTVFKRYINGSTFYYNSIDKTPIIKERVLPAKAFRKTKPHYQIIEKSKFMTIDIETVFVNGFHIPYLICGYSNGKSIHTFNKDVSSNDATVAMFEEFISQLITFKDVNYVYAHNFSGFDGIFLFRHLMRYKGASIKPVVFKGRLVAVNFTIKVTDKKR